MCTCSLSVSLFLALGYPFFSSLMATASQKPNTQNPQLGNPTSKDHSPQPPKPMQLNRTEYSPVPSAQEQSMSENSTAKTNGDDSKAKGTQTATGVTVVSPTASSGRATDTQKKLRRAERFGMPVQFSEEEKRNSRAERFGMGSGSDSSKTSEEQKRKARAERFRLPVQSVADEEAKKKARLARFALVSNMDSMEEEKRKARAIRFSQALSSSVSHVNDKDNIEPKAATAGKAVGGA